MNLSTSSQTIADDQAPIGSRQVPFALAEITPEAQEAAAKVLRSGWVTTGPEVIAFEEEFASWVHADDAVAVASCTDALEISLDALRLPAGAKVLTSTMTFCGAVQAILHANLFPVLVDVDPLTLMPDEAATAAAAEAAGGADAMVVLHFAGHPAPVGELAAAAGLPLNRVIEDSAHALGARLGEVPVGSASTASCFSFYATKNLPIGEGGMITTADPVLAEYARTARLHGMTRDAWQRYQPGGTWRYNVKERGHKANMTDLQAAIGRAQLVHLRRWQERRALLARRYDQQLAGIEGITTPSRPTGGQHAWHLYVVQVEESFGIDRDSLLAMLSDRGVHCSVHFIPVHHHAYFRCVIGDDIPDLPCADAAAAKVLSLPLYPGLSFEDIDAVCDAIADVQRSAVRRRRRHRATITSTLNGGSDLLRAVVVGAGVAGRAVARDLRQAPDYGLRPIGFLDDRSTTGRIDGLPVLGPLSELRSAVAAHSVQAVIVAIPSLGAEKIRHIVKEAEAAGAVVRYLPSFVAALERDVRVSDLRHLRVDQLLGRREIRVMRRGSRSVMEGKRVLVTGAGGSIGSELCRQIQQLDPSALYLLDHDESNLHRTQLELEGAALLQSDALIIGDIRDWRRIRQLFAELRPQVVFHAAAHKHLPLLELHPHEGVKSNVLGTQNVIRAAKAAGAERFILISTDKAADPTSVLGATKRLAEIIVADEASGPMRCASVRFGNVLGSRGSFLSVLAEQIETGQPVTITDPDVSRFFMTVEEAVGLVIEAAGAARDGETFVLDMGEPVRIVDLVRNYITQLHLDESRITVRYTGLRPGEKLNESLFGDAESPRRTAHPKIWCTTTPRPGPMYREQVKLLYAAANRNAAAEVRERLRQILPGYHAEVSSIAPLSSCSAPYPDGF